MKQKILTLEEIITHLEKRNLTKLSYKTEISRQTLSGIVNGTQTNPSYNVIKKLSDYLTENAVGSEFLVIGE